MANIKTLMEVQELKDLLQDEIGKLKLKQVNNNFSSVPYYENYILKGEIKMMNKIIPILNDIILNKY
tara:strand:- start:374 stop:574 length:201 start_codon:yes stop_codon:yes gene_type:complete